MYNLFSTFFYRVTISKNIQLKIYLLLITVEWCNVVLKWPRGSVKCDTSNLSLLIDVPNNYKSCLVCHITSYDNTMINNMVLLSILFFIVRLISVSFPSLRNPNRERHLHFIISSRGFHTLTARHFTYIDATA